MTERSSVRDALDNFRPGIVSMGSFPRHREPDGLYHSPKVSRYRERTRMDVRRAAEEHARPKKMMMNESRQTRGAATAAGASTSSSPGGVAEQIAAQQHPATHPAALSISRKMEMTAPPGE